MISIERDELEKYDQLGSGKYGVIYQVDDNIAYKIYKETIMGKDGYPMINPALCASKARLKRLLNRSKRLQYTDLIQDIILIDGYFGGVCIPYYPGCTLETLRYSNYDLKKDISRQLVRNNQELKNNLIYPLDYHLGNVMVVDDTAKIIDLDDPLTRICRLPDLIYSLSSSGRLNETIQDLFGEFDVTLYNKSLFKKLQRKRSSRNSSSNWLENFIKEKESLNDYLLIHSGSNLEEIKELLRNHSFRVIYVLKEKPDNSNLLPAIIEFFKKEGITIFDFVLEEKLNHYFLNFPVDNKVLVDEEAKVLQKK